MDLCEKCAQLPERQDGLPADGLTAHLTAEKRLGASTPHFPKKYTRDCPECGTRWGIAHVNSWDSVWKRLDNQPE
jgi:hypothetical protein